MGVSIGVYMRCKVRYSTHFDGFVRCQLGWAEFPRTPLLVCFQLDRLQMRV